MTTLHLGVEELIARQRAEAIEYNVRHTWNLTEFWRHDRRPEHSAARLSKGSAKMTELVELGITQARWVMV